jgi:hypothetical protein
MVNILCLLWLPVFFLFWMAVRPASQRGVGKSATAGVLVALPLGIITALIWFFGSPFVQVQGRGLERIVSVFIDVNGVFLLIPLVLGWVLRVSGVFNAEFDITAWTLLFLFPVAAAASINSDPDFDPALLYLRSCICVLIPIDAAIVFRLLRNKTRWLLALMLPYVLAWPVLGAACYWAFFVQERLLGWALLTAIALPALIYLSMLFVKRLRGTRSVYEKENSSGILRRA